MKRVIVTQPVVGICHMQVCAVADAADDEVLEVANRESPSGTSLGWASVVRSGPNAPVRCKDHPERLHLLLEC